MATGGTITTGNIARLVEEGVNAVFGQVYDEFPVEYTYIFDEFGSTRNFEIDQQFEGFGLFSNKPEAESLEFDSQTQGYSPTYTHNTWGKAFVVSEEALEDEMYGVFARRARALAFAGRQTKEINGANILNLGFDTTSTMENGDGNALFATDHILGPSGGTGQNKLTVDAPLSETSLEDMTILMGKAVDTRGLRINLKPTRLIIPVDLAYVAQRILGSVLQNYTANNATNALRDLNAIPEGQVVNHYLTSPTAWFLKTDVVEGLKCFNRRPMRFQDDNAFTTETMRFKASERYSFGWTDFRGAYGTTGA